ncbi:hypothetical protein GCM10010409_21670 [Mycolicibacterium diernhoferi]
MRHIVAADVAEYAPSSRDPGGWDQVLYVLSTATSGYLTLRVCGRERISSTVHQHGGFTKYLSARGRYRGPIGHTARPGGIGAAEESSTMRSPLSLLPKRGRVE